MRIGVGLILIAIGAILKFAVTGHISGINVQTVGVVLILVGVIGLLITFVRLSVRRRTDVIHRGRDVTYLEPADPADSADPRY
jgi:heme/copper-type cytochrome/quinol oxidase subunit 2